MRIALFSRRIPGDDRIWVATGVAGAIGLARGPSLALLVLAAAALGALPVWPVAVLAAALPVGAVVAYVARHWRPHARVGHVLDVFGALGGCPPGNVGVGSGAVAVALSLAGIGFGTALSAGIAFQALETAVSVLGGSAGVAYLARPPVPAWWLRAAGTAGCLCLAGAFGATVLI
jgi:hypothetical protein